MVPSSIARKALALVGAVSVLGLCAFVPNVNAQVSSGEELLPPNAKTGECYARVWVPPVYETETLDVLVREASSRIEVIPAKYEWGTEEVLTKEGYEKLEIVPAKYEWREEKIMVKPVRSQLVTVAPQYEWVEEKIVDRPAHTIWKKGQNPVSRVDGSTGEIMCLVEVPATYKIVRKKTLKAPATTKQQEIPAEYMTVRKRVLVQEETVKRTAIPAQYKTVKVQKLVTPPTEKKIEIPAEYNKVTKRKLVKDGSMEWRAILCETNMQGGLVSKIQRALKNAGFDPGPVDGAMGSGTLRAVESFQKSKGLAQGGITMETLEALGVRAGS